MGHISKYLQTGNGVSLQELKPTANGDLVKALKDKKLTEALIGELDMLFRRCMIKVGIREINLPGKEETSILYQHVLKNFGTHTIAEIDLAFEMAITDKLEIKQEDVNAYENFSCAYVSKIISAYRRWAAHEYRQIQQEPPPLPKTTHIEWRGIIEKDYQIFLSGKKGEYRKYPSEFYDVLVNDGFINPFAYKDHIDTCRNKLIGELNRQLVDNRKLEDEYGEKYSEEKHIEKKIIEYRNMSKEAEVHLLSKQCIVWMLFKMAREQKRKNIYAKVD